MLPFAHFLMGSSSRAPGRLLWETVDVAEGEAGCGVQDQRRILRVPSTGWKHGWLGAFCSLLHPAPLLLKKGRDRRGLAVPPISCSSHDTASAARAGPALSRCPAMAGPFTVPGCRKRSSISRGRLIRTPQRGGRIQPFVLQKKKQRNSLASVPATGHSARLTMQTPCRLTVTPVRALPRLWDGATGHKVLAH